MGTRRAILVVFVLAACSKKDEPAPAPRVAVGSAGSASATPTPQPPSSRESQTPQARIERFETCFGAATSGDTTTMERCYVEHPAVTRVDAEPSAAAHGRAELADMARAIHTAFPNLRQDPQLIMINGDRVGVVYLTTGTNDGELMGQPATHKQVGMFEAEIAVLAGDGKISEERVYSDQSTLRSQLGIEDSELSPAVITAGWGTLQRRIANHDDTETKNVELVKRLIESINRRDTNGVEAELAEDVRFYDHVENSEKVTKAAHIQCLKDFLGITSDEHIDVRDLWAAGDWVVAEVVMTATLAVDVPGANHTRGKKLTTSQLRFFRIADGKVEEHHIFSNQLAKLVQLGSIGLDDLGAKHR